MLFEEKFAGIAYSNRFRDLKCMAKIANAILILRNGKSIYWTDELDQGMINWCTRFIEWFTTYWIALEEAVAKKLVLLSDDSGS